VSKKFEVFWRVDGTKYEVFCEVLNSAIFGFLALKPPRVLALNPKGVGQLSLESWGNFRQSPEGLKFCSATPKGLISSPLRDLARQNRLLSAISVGDWPLKWGRTQRVLVKSYWTWGKIPIGDFK